MNPELTPSFHQPRERELPAQEQGVIAGEFIAVLSAEQVYAQRLAETSQRSDVPGPAFVP
ncbi:MAG: hypothetical protein N2117_07130 [Anaerolineales bacterium]|nr:hypothetical protein [Anaerolineales bacterium]MCX7755003.1 hypothetical protein [Anaerolineales bacterium]MDW8278788.1 hypothetical protein [Anaerolineales bacterium]